jgi:glutathione S-transferase
MKPITNAIAGRIESAFLNPNFESNWAFLENQLKTCGESEGSDVSKTVTEPYLCAPRLTGADILMSFPLIAAKGRGTTLKAEKYPLLYKYIERIEQEPGYKKAVAKIVEIEGSFTAAF